MKLKTWHLILAAIGLVGLTALATYWLTSKRATPREQTLEATTQVKNLQDDLKNIKTGLLNLQSSMERRDTFLMNWFAAQNELNADNRELIEQFLEASDRSELLMGNLYRNMSADLQRRRRLYEDAAKVNMSPPIVKNSTKN